MRAPYLQLTRLAFWLVPSPRQSVSGLWRNVAHARSILALVLLPVLIGASAKADLSSHDPTKLCGVLRSMGVETSAFAIVDGARPYCYTLRNPGDSERGYDYTYHVIGGDVAGRAHQLFVALRGPVAEVINKEPQERFVEMSERVLAQFLLQTEVRDIAAALREVGPYERGSAMARGMQITFSRVHWPVPGVPELVEIRLSVSNTCADPRKHEELWKRCVDANPELTWRTRRELMK